MSESIRERLARVLSTQTTCDGQACPSGVHYRQADAVLAEYPILAGVTDEMVEAGAYAARRFYDRVAGTRGQAIFPLDYREIGAARAVLEAALGKEPSDEL